MTPRELCTLLLLSCLGLGAGPAGPPTGSLVTQGFVIVDGDE